MSTRRGEHTGLRNSGKRQSGGKVQQIHGCLISKGSGAQSRLVRLERRNAQHTTETRRNRTTKTRTTRSVADSTALPSARSDIASRARTAAPATTHRRMYTGNHLAWSWL